MLDHLDKLLRELFASNVSGIASGENQVRFEPPDEDWRTYVSGLNTALALNVYLVDLRENRKLRSNERVRTSDNGLVSETQAPRRVDCHYLITAWSPAQASQEPTPDEHALLYNATVALTRSEPLVPRQVYYPDDLPLDFPAEFADEELPTALLPVEGFPKIAEFWGTMGVKHRWKPAIWLVVTVPVLYLPELAGPMVTTSRAESRVSGVPETAEAWVQIGGRVFNTKKDPPELVNGAWVRLTTPADAPLQITQTNELGRFTFGGLGAGTFRLHAHAVELGIIHKDIAVPSPTGEYDLQF